MDEFVPADINETSAETLNISMVRWFYKQNEQWSPFSGYDSIRLEEKHLQLSGLDKNSASPFQITDDTVVVNGNMYKASIFKRNMYPIFWTECQDNCSEIAIIRGIWFYHGTNLPLESESLSDIIESHHLTVFHLESVKSNEKNLTVMDRITQKLTRQLKSKITSMDAENYHVEWTGVNDTFIYKSSVKQNFLDKTGLGRVVVGKRIYRGYHQPASKKDRLPNVSHLCFIIQWPSSVENALRLKMTCERSMNSFHLESGREKKRVEFIPVEWDRALNAIHSNIEAITPPNNIALRRVMSSSFMSILNYSNQIFQCKAIDSLKSELNRLYLLFCLHHKHFLKIGGKVSVITHSLSSVLMYDLLQSCPQHKAYEGLKIDSMDREERENESSRVSSLLADLQSRLNVDDDKKQRQDDNIMRNRNHLRLVFNVDHLFNLGSPLAIFLLLRTAARSVEISPENIITSKLCRRFYNIFHSADLTVFRIEPLFNEAYRNIEPVGINFVNQAKRQSYSSGSDKIIIASNIEDSFKSSQKNILDKGYFSSEIAEYVKFEYKSMENSAETLVKDLSKIGMLNKDTYEHSCRQPTSTKSANSFYYQKHMNIIEARNASNIIYSINVYNDPNNKQNSDSSRSTSKRRDYLSQSIGDTDRIDSINNMTIVDPLTNINNEACEFDCKFSPSGLVNGEALKRRLDYLLAEDQNWSPFSSTFFSDEAYWINENLCRFIVLQIYEEDLDDWKF